MKTIGFIGGGRVTRIILGGWRRAGTLPDKVVVSDPTSAIATTKNNLEAAAQDIVFLAVHPPMMGAVLAEIVPALKTDAVVVSLAPKFTIARISAALGGFARIVRVIPNAPSLVGAGFNPMAFAPSLNAAERAEVTALWQPLGQCPVVAEEKLELFALLSARGPQYLWFQFQELERLGVAFGLTTDEASAAVRQMARGAVATLAEAELSTEAVIDLIPFRMGEAEESIRTALRANVEAGYQSLKV